MVSIQQQIKTTMKYQLFRAENTKICNKEIEFKQLYSTRKIFYKN